MSSADKKIFSHAVIRGIAAVLPKERLGINAWKTEYGDKETTNIANITGIRELRTAPAGTTASDYCAEAANILFTVTDLNPDMIDAVIFVSQSPDYPVPHTAAILQHRLGLPASTIATDMVLGCTGYVYGLFTAMALIEAGCCKNVLLCAGDTMHRRVHSKDKVLRMEIGDAGTATWISAKGGVSASSFSFFTDGGGADALMIAHGGSRHPASYNGAGGDNNNASIIDERACRTDMPENLYMDGMRLMRFALQEVPPTIDNVLQSISWTKTEVNLFAFHQSSEPVLKYIAKKLGVTQQLVPVGVTMRGNTGAASIPVMLCDLYPGRNTNLHKTVVCGFGAGLAVATGAMDLSFANICQTSEI